MSTINRQFLNQYANLDRPTVLSTYVSILLSFQDMTWHTKNAPIDDGRTDVDIDTVYG